MASISRVCSANDDIDTEANELGRKRRQPIVEAFGPDIVDGDIAAFRVANLTETALKGVEKRRTDRGGPSEAITSRRLVCRERSIVRGDGGSVHDTAPVATGSP